MPLLDTAQNFLQGGLGFGGFEGYTSNAPALIFEQEGAQSVSSSPGGLAFAAKRTIILRGRALPTSPLQMPRKQRTVTTYYPGNPQATVQVLGTTYGSTTISGVWKYRFVGDPTYEMYSVAGFGDLDFNLNVDAADRTPQTLVKAFEKLLDEGIPVVVEWNDQQRRGIIKEFTPKWLRSQDVEWSLTIEWFAKGPDVLRAKNLDLPGAPVVTWASLLDDIMALEPRFLLPDVAAIVTSRIAAIREGVGTVFDFIRFSQTQTETPISAIQAVNTAAFEIRLEAEEVISRTKDTPYTDYTSRDDVDAVLGMEGWRRTVGTRSAELRSATQKTARDFNEQNAPGTLQVVVVPQNTTLRDLSRVYYGTADDWQLIADINFLDESQVEAGTTLIIPSKPAQRSTSAPGTTPNASSGG
jgi:hypothetical protein